MTNITKQPDDPLVLHTQIDNSRYISFCERLTVRKNIDQKTSIFVSNTGENTKRFKGKIEENSFRISRYIDYKNSFLPVIKGDISSNKNNDTEIQLKMSTHIFVKIFSI